MFLLDNQYGNKFSVSEVTLHSVGRTIRQFLSEKLTARSLLSLSFRAVRFAAFEAYTCPLHDISIPIISRSHSRTRLNSSRMVKCIKKGPDDLDLGRGRFSGRAHKPGSRAGKPPDLYMLITDLVLR